MAQGLGEYGALVGGGQGTAHASSRLDEIVAAVENAVRNPTPKTWLAIGAFLFVLWFFLIRRR
jgi:hypothetical protein